ncbi:MAG: Mrp/NBP35 family ATP-binding protein [Aaplasma endosymbiont of Hyalomma asiaticum]
MVTEFEVLKVLRDAVDVSTGKKISELGELSVTVNKEGIGIILLIAEQKSAEWEQKFKKNCSTIVRSSIVGASKVSVAIVAPEKKQLFSRTKIPGIKNVILVASGKGGVGKSTVAALTALTLARQGHSVSLVDADIYGPSIPQLLGIKNLAEVDDHGMLIPIQVQGVQSISVANIIENKDKAIVWRGPMLSKAINRLITYTLWSPCDYMIIDTPPGTGDAHISIAKGYDITGAMVVSTPHELSVTQALKTCDMLKNLEVRLLGIVENMSYFVDQNSGHKVHIFGDNGGAGLAERAGTVLLGAVCIHPNIDLLAVNMRSGPIDRELCKTYEDIASSMLKSISTT